MKQRIQNILFVIVYLKINSRMIHREIGPIPFGQE